MSSVIDDIKFLSKEIGPRPAGTEEERRAAMYIAEQIQKRSGLAFSIEDFDAAKGRDKIYTVYAIFASILIIFASFLPIITIPGMVLCLIIIALYVAEMLNKPIFSPFLKYGISQNVVAKYEPAFSPEKQNTQRKRKLVFISHYDSGFAIPDTNGNLFFLSRIASIASFVSICIMVVVLCLRAFVFTEISGVGILVFVIVSLLLAIIALIPTFIRLFKNRLGYNEGANCNASGSAALIEIAKQLGTGALGQQPYDEGQVRPVVHGEQSAVDAGLVPEDATVNYVAQKTTEQPTASVPFDELASKRAAQGAQAGQSELNVQSSQHDQAGQVSQFVQGVQSHQSNQFKQAAKADVNAQPIQNAQPTVQSKPSDPLDERKSNLESAKAAIAAFTAPRKARAKYDDEGNVIEDNTNALSGDTATSSAPVSDNNEAAQKPMVGVVSDEIPSPESSNQVAGGTQEKISASSASITSGATASTKESVPSWFKSAQDKARKNQDPEAEKKSVARSRFAHADEELERKRQEEADRKEREEEAKREKLRQQIQMAKQKEEKQKEEQVGQQEPFFRTDESKFQNEEAVAKASTAPFKPVEVAEPSNIPVANSNISLDERFKRAQSSNTNTISVNPLVNEQIKQELQNSGALSQINQVDSSAAEQSMQATDVTSEPTQQDQVATAEQSQQENAPVPEQAKQETADSPAQVQQANVAASSQPQQDYDVPAQATIDEKSDYSVDGQDQTTADKQSSDQPEIKRTSPSVSAALREVNAAIGEASISAQPGQPQAAQPQPAESHIAQPHPAQAQGEETQSAQPQPTQAQPAETQSAQPQPAQPQPAETQSAQPQPTQHSADQGDSDTSSVLDPQQSRSFAMPGQEEKPMFADLDNADKHKVPLTEINNNQGVPHLRADSSGPINIKGNSQYAPLADENFTSQNAEVPAEAQENSSEGQVDAPADIPTPDTSQSFAPNQASDTGKFGTGSFARISENQGVAGATGTFAPVKEQLIDEAAHAEGNQDIIVGDADDTDFVQGEYTDAGAFAGPGYVDMPDKKRKGLLGLFGNKSTEGKHSSNSRKKQNDDLINDDLEWDGGAFSPLDKLKFDKSKLNKANPFKKNNTEDFDDQEQVDVQQDEYIEEQSQDAYHGAKPFESEDGKISRMVDAVPSFDQQIQDFHNGSVNIEVWMVALGAEIDENAGIKAFLLEHAQELRGAVIVDIEGIGAGQLSMISSEGMLSKAQPSSRIKRSIRKAAADLGITIPGVSLSWSQSSSAYANRRGFKSVKLAGIQENKPAYYLQKEDYFDIIEEDTLNTNIQYLLKLIQTV